MKKKIYLAGPIRGKKDGNFDTFQRAANKLRSENHFVFNPFDQDIKMCGSNPYAGTMGDADVAASRGLDFKKVFHLDVHFISTECEMMVMLPQWERSVGARAEHELAVALNLPIIYLSEEDLKN
jgi:uncharacterized protein DUF4406